MDTNAEFKPRISNTLALVLVLSAIITDLIQGALTLIGFVVLGAILNTLVSFFAMCFFGIVLAVNGVSFLSTRKIALAGVTIVTEVLPILNNIPSWTLSMIALVVMVRKEDQEQFNISQRSVKNKPARSNRNENTL
ncbi:MAG: hypothetical protein OQJ98_03105 [Candidatus Pacebacteria bacterium]|nr:hypothetical protein [Candidatus Paceibacterota bacterium]